MERFTIAVFSVVNSDNNQVLIQQDNLARVPIIGLSKESVQAQLAHRLPNLELKDKDWLYVKFIVLETDKFGNNGKKLLLNFVLNGTADEVKRKVDTLLTVIATENPVPPESQPPPPWPQD